MWIIDHIVSKGDYNYAVVYDHPNRTKHNYVLEHRVVIENHIGRLLKEDEVVHHKDGNKKNNSIDNLELMLDYEHSRHHGVENGTHMVELRCVECGCIFHRYRRQTHLIKKNNTYTACSRSCNGKFSRSKQLYGLTLSMENSIQHNVIKEYTSFTEHDL